MPTNVYVPEGEVLEGSDVFLVSRVVRADGVYLSKADITTGYGTALTISVYDLSDRSIAQDNVFQLSKTGAEITAGVTGLFVAASASGLSTDGYWDGLDTTGYNFMYRLLFDATGATGPNLEGGKRYRVEFDLVTDTSFGTVRWAHILSVRSMSGT